MSFKRNILASYISQIYVTLIGILVFPLYLKYMGAEAYGLFGFFAVLQACFQLLDVGLSPTSSRETARFVGGAISAFEYRQLYRSLSIIFLVIAAFGGLSLFLLAEAIADHWLKGNSLSINEIVLALQIMAVIVALRWMSGLYRGVLTGFERLVWLGNFNILFATLRYVCVFPVMWLYGFTPFVFFFYQLIIATLELLWLGLKCHSLLPHLDSLEGSVGWSFHPVRRILKFALTIAFTSSVWVLVTQTDKLLLSGILPLADYGYFTLAVLVASAVSIVSSPVSTAIMPRMAKLHAEKKNAELLNVYRNATQIVSITAGSVAITFAACSEPLLFAWTGDKELATQTAIVLTLYSVGNGLLAVASFAYYLQYARGDLRYHLIGNVGLLVILIPAIGLAAKYYGAVGAGYAWLVINGLFLFCWVAYVHHKLESGLHCSWLYRDVLTICVPAICIAYALTRLDYYPETRVQSLFYVAALGSVAMFVSAIFSTYVRARVNRMRH